MSVPREKLYEEVWAEPMTTVAKRYEVSSAFLAQVCDRLNLPRPTSGHWQQRQVGRAPERPPLPKPRPGDALAWDGPLPPAPRVPTEPLPPRLPRKPGERPSRHPLVVGALEEFERGIVSTYQDEKYAKPYKRNIVDVLTSQACAKRALDVASKLFLALEDRGHRVLLAPSNDHYERLGLHHRDDAEKQTDSDYRYAHGVWRGPAKPTLVLLGTVAIGLTVFELSEHVEVRHIGGDVGYARVGSREERAAPRRPGAHTTKEWRVSGRLGVHAYAPHGQIRWERYWRETKPGDLSAQFEVIARELEAGAPAIVKLLEKEEREAEERRKKYEIERRESERKEAERRNIEDEKARLVEFKEQLARWRFTRDARALVATARELAAKCGLRVTKGGPVEEWFDWILKHAQEPDPLAKLRKDVNECMAEKHGTFPRPRSPIGTLFALRRRQQGR